MARVLVAMSGGVDSSVTALLLKRAGHECVGVTMRLLDGEQGKRLESDIADAEKICEKLGMEHHVLDAREAFTEQVIRPFSDAYARALTPNPCIRCNKHLKFGLLRDFAHELGCDALATGHYARVVHDEATGEAELLCAHDAEKDQSYVLYPVVQEVLRELILPLGELADKDETRRIAEENGLLTAHKSDSQDICFVPDGDYAGFLERFRGEPFAPGEIVDASGEVVGMHEGIERFTIGQRKGVDVAVGHRVYVTDKDPDTKRIRIDVEDAIFTSEFLLEDVNWISGKTPGEPVRGEIVVCYHGRRYPVVATPQPDSGLRVVSEVPIRAIAPGQSAVLYAGERVLAGGVIAR